MRSPKFKRNIIILLGLLAIILTLFLVIQPAIHVTEIIRLDENPGINPVFSPNGEQIAFGRNGKLVVINLSTDSQSEHEVDGTPGEVQWLSDSRLVYLKRANQSAEDFSHAYRFWVFDTQTDQSSPLTKIWYGLPQHFAVSSLTSKISLIEQDTIYVFDPLEDTYVTIYLKGRHNCDFPMWQSEETLIYSCSQQLWKTNIISRKSELLLELEECHCSAFSPSPDGRWLLYEESTDEIPPDSSFYIVQLQNRPLNFNTSSRLNLAGSFIKHLVTPNYFAWPGVSQTVWAPDGSSFVFSGSWRVWDGWHESFQDGIWLVKLD